MADLAGVDNMRCIIPFTTHLTCISSPPDGPFSNIFMLTDVTEPEMSYETVKILYNFMNLNNLSEVPED